MRACIFSSVVSGCGVLETGRKRLEKGIIDAHDRDDRMPDPEISGQCHGIIDAAG